MPWPTHQNWQLWLPLRKKLTKLRSFQLSHFELSIHMWQHSSNTWIWSIYLFQDFLDRGLLLTRKLLNQGFLVVRLYSSRWKVVTVTWLTAMEYSCHTWPRICSVRRNRNTVLSSSKIYHRVCKKNSTTVATSRTGTVYPSGAPEFIPVVSEVRVAGSLVFCAMFCWSLFACLVFFLLAIAWSVLLWFTASDFSWVMLLIFNCNMKQWWSSIPPISTKRSITSLLSWTQCTEKRPWRGRSPLLILVTRSPTTVLILFLSIRIVIYFVRFLLT